MVKTVGEGNSPQSRRGSEEERYKLAAAEECIMEQSQKKPFIRIRGAAENNLKNLNVDIPRNEPLSIYYI